MKTTRPGMLINPKEAKVFEIFLTNGSVTIHDLAAHCFDGKLHFWAHSQARNSLRRLVKWRWVQQTGCGQYKLNTRVVK